MQGIAKLSRALPNCAGHCQNVQATLETEAVKERQHAYIPSQLDTARQDSLQLLTAALDIPNPYCRCTNMHKQDNRNIKCPWACSVEAFCEVHMWLRFHFN